MQIVPPNKVHNPYYPWQRAEWQRRRREELGSIAEWSFLPFTLALGVNVAACGKIRPDLGFWFYVSLAAFIAAYVVWSIRNPNPEEWINDDKTSI